jgi:hypothetical protein
MKLSISKLASLLRFVARLFTSCAFILNEQPHYGRFSVFVEKG